MSEPDLRARIEAQVAARRAASALPAASGEPVESRESRQSVARSGGGGVALSPGPDAPMESDMTTHDVSPGPAPGSPTSPESEPASPPWAEPTPPPWAEPASPRSARHRRPEVPTPVPGRRRAAHQAGTAPETTAPETAPPATAATVASAPAELEAGSGPAAVDSGPPSRERRPTRLERRRPSRRRRYLSLAITIVVAFALATALRVFVIASYYIPSASMEPTLHGCTGCNNDHVLVDKLSYEFHSVHRGDVVVFSRPANLSINDKVLIKRVIGLPGDTLTDRNNSIYVNGEQLKEPYVNPQCGGTQSFPAAPVVVPKGEVFVMGDNRCDSEDSRVFGPIPTSSIIGRAFMIVWPLGRVHYL